MEERRNIMSDKELQHKIEQLEKQLEEIKSREPVVTISQMQKMLEAVLAAAKSPNVLEQKQLDAQIEQERRRTQLSLELAKVEEEKIRRRKEGCSHRRYPQGSKNGGQP